MTVAASRPRTERKTFSRAGYDDVSSDSSSEQVAFSTPSNVSPTVTRPPPVPQSRKEPYAKALYDFDAG